MSSRFPEAGETVVGSRFLTYPGGKGANQAVAVARSAQIGDSGTEAHVRLIGRVGDDPYGAQLLESLQRKGVDVSGVGIEAGRSSGIAVIYIDATGQNRIVQIPGANHTCGSAELERVRDALRDASVLMLQLEVSMEVSLAAAKEAASRGRVVILDPAPSHPLPAEFYQYCGYITPNETEAAALVGFSVTDSDSAEKAAKELLCRGVENVIIKMGALGAYHGTAEGGRYLHAYQVQAVDTVAAGDAFNGAPAVALAEGRNTDEALRRAMAAGALAVTRTGAQDSMPHKHEVEAFLSLQQAG